MSIEVQVVSNTISVNLENQQNIEVDTNVAATRFTDLIDFDDANKHDQYVIMYDALSGTYKLVNPDKVLSSAAVDEPIQPGLPGDFVDTLDVDLDDRIDLDAGTF